MPLYAAQFFTWEFFRYAFVFSLLYANIKWWSKASGIWCVSYISIIFKLYCFVTQKRVYLKRVKTLAISRFIYLGGIFILADIEITPQERSQEVCEYALVQFSHRCTSRRTLSIFLSLANCRFQLIILVEPRRQCLPIYSPFSGRSAKYHSFQLGFQQ
jgi:hypothetical protein